MFEFNGSEYSRFQAVWQGNFFDFLKTKIIASVKMKGIQGFSDFNPFTPYKQDFICNLKFGDLLKDSGDILLCPLSEGFKPSNPLSRQIIVKEGKWLKDEIESLYQGKRSNWIGFKHVVFLPCRKLKYRGIIFVSVDFYSENRREVNVKRIAEAFEVAEKYNCARLSCPKNFLYVQQNEWYIFDCNYSGYGQVEEVVNCLPSNTKIDFIVDIVIQKNLHGYQILNASYAKYDFRTAVIEQLPQCSEILPHYRKKIKQIRTVYSIPNRIARLIRRILIYPIVEVKAIKAFNRIVRYMGYYYESSPENGNEGFSQFILRMCKEMPWNEEVLKKSIKKFYKDEDNES